MLLRVAKHLHAITATYTMSHFRETCHMNGKLLLTIRNAQKEQQAYEQIDAMFDKTNINSY